MALRMIEMVLPEKELDDISDILSDCQVIDHWKLCYQENQLLLRLLLDAEHVEAVLEILEKRFIANKENRLVIFPVEATLPRAEPEAEADPEKAANEQKAALRISREELYEDIKDSTNCSWTFFAMTFLSTIVAAVGLQQNNVALIIGAMVIAPLLGPNVALALSTTLGDLSLLWRASKTNIAGIITALIFSMLLGTIMKLDVSLSEVTSRTGVSMGAIIVALASGCAGVLAFTTGISTTLIGVMVAVALLPPLVTSGLLLGGGQFELALGAFLLFLVNLICVNLAGVLTFFVQGIQPTTWYDKDRASKATRTAIVLWGVLLAVLIGIVLLLKK